MELISILWLCQYGHLLLTLAFKHHRNRPTSVIPNVLECHCSLLLTELTLCYYQFVTCIPTHRLPKELALVTVTHEEIEKMEKENEEDNADEAGQRGQILWIRGLSRLQHQVCSVYDSVVSNVKRLYVC